MPDELIYPEDARSITISRAEHEQLRAERDQWHAACKELRAELARLNAQNDALRAELDRQKYSQGIDTP